MSSDIITLIPDTMILRGEKKFIQELATLQQSGKIQIGSHEGILLECMSTENITISKQLIQYLSVNANVWFCNQTEAVQRTHSALLSGSDLPTLSLPPVEALAERIKFTLALSITPDEWLLHLRKLRKLAQVSDSTNIRNFVNSKTSTKLPFDTTQMTHKCLNPDDEWYGFALNAILTENSVEGYDSSSDEVWAKIRIITKNLNSTPGFRLFYAHLVHQLLQVMTDPTKAKKPDQSYTADAQHLLYLSPNTMLVTNDSVLHETQKKFLSSQHSLILKVDEAEKLLANIK